MHLREMQRLAQEVWRLRPEHVDTDASVGELAWFVAFEDPEDWNVRLFGDDAWGWIMAPGTLVWQVDPRAPHALDDVLDWFEATTDECPLRTSTRDANADAAQRLNARGYEPDESAVWHRMTRHNLENIGEVRVPAGYSAATMQEFGNVAARVEVHRAAWEPSRLTVESYTRATRTWPYRADLDFVVVAPDGSLAASALGWYDDVNRVGEFEPVGTHPAHRRIGLGQALMNFGLSRLAEAGASEAIVACRGDDDYPVPWKLYRSVGFRELSRQVQMVKRQTTK